MSNTGCGIIVLLAIVLFATVDADTITGIFIVGVIVALVAGFRGLKKSGHGDQTNRGHDQRRPRGRWHRHRYRRRR